MCPLFQTSANLSGEPAPSAFTEVPAEIVASADLAIDGGSLTGLPSTVVDLTDFDDTGEWRVLRAGGLDPAELSARLAALTPR
jgi:tRNA A37 threonylcarbamoyladenosine synthetase subunit TsaC/SUA5/YrdC